MPLIVSFPGTQHLVSLVMVPILLWGMTFGLLLVFGMA